MKLTACGSNGVDIVEIKEYKLFVDTDNDQVRREITSLVDRFNANACIKILTYTDSRSEANSFAKIVPGLEAASCKSGAQKPGEDDCKVGWGQWVRQIYQKKPVTFSQGNATATYVYSMNMEFDQDYFFARMGSTDEAKRLDLFKLFTHETGHGLQEEHVYKNTRSVMYPNISGDKDFPSFFRGARQYMGADPNKSC